MRHFAFVCVGICSCFSITFNSAFAKPQQVMKPDEAGFKKIVQPFLKKYCIECHGANDAQAEFRVDKKLTNEFLDLTVKGHWAEMVNVLNGHEMPPEDETQPTHQEVAKVVDWITEQMTQAELYRRSSAIVLRRLNRNEYQRTLRDLVGVDIDVSSIPQDPATGGFDNNGGALIISHMHLELYQKLARLALDRALVDGPQPEKIKWRFEAESGDSDSNRVKRGEDRRNRAIIINGGKGRVEGKYKVLYDHLWNRNNINVRTFFLSHEGNYVVRVHAGGKVPDRSAVLASVKKAHKFREDGIRAKGNTKQADWYAESWRKQITNHFNKSNIYNYGSPRFKLTQHLAGQPKILAEVDVTASPENPETYETKAHFTQEGVGLTVSYAYDIPREFENAWIQKNQIESLARPEVWVDWIEIEGPVYESWPPPSHRGIFIDTRIRKSRKNEIKYARVVLNNFMRRAYRRPVTRQEVDAKLALFSKVRKSSPSFVEAMKTPLVAVMVSPHFLYMPEPQSSKASHDDSLSHQPRSLNAHELASRLSYFLWSTMPDDELFKLADSGALKDKKTLVAQVDRMLKDPKAKAFNINFAGQWLGVRNVGANPPVAGRFPRYDRHLELSIIKETEEFFNEILKNDLSITKFIDSEFVVVNERLARFYGIEGVKGDHFQKIKVSQDIHRGGVITQPAFLSTAANGTRTLPVKRGRWVMKNIFGVDPGIPVANVGEISPKVPGIDKATVRQRLELHRKLPQCARCHNRIDPLGLALENYDASGQWREREGFGYQGRIEKNDPLIDASSQMLDGTKIDGIGGLKKELMKNKELFYRCLSKKMLTYALSRELGITDQKYVNNGVKELNQKEDTLRTLIKYVVTSEPFMTK